MDGEISSHLRSKYLFAVDFTKFKPNTLANKLKHILLAAIILIIHLNLKAQQEKKSQLSLDFGYALTGVINSGWGMGVSYERLFTKALSYKAVFGHMTFQTEMDKVNCTSVSLSLFLSYYFQKNGFTGWYGSLGNGVDFPMFFGANVSEIEKDGETGESLIYFYPLIGYNLTKIDWLHINMFAGYKVFVSHPKLYDGIQKYFNDGPQVGVGLHFYLKRFLNRNKAELE